ncbi:MAG: hypothetical protein HY901_31260 [Deltaproteobacteria bacterium]|nr:hypothetical protein [Deltaproteobacteria bacterium]
MVRMASRVSMTSALLASACLVLAAGCDEGASAASDAALPQFDAAGVRDAANAQDASLPADGSIAADASVAMDASAQSDASNAYVDERGFTIRIPQERTIVFHDPIGGGTSTVKAWDTDYVCTFKHGAADGFFYVQATPLENLGMGGGMVVRTEGGWWSFAQAVTSATGVVYDWGGNHHNDSIDVEYQGKTYRYYHSSFGYGWRSCHPPDCLQVVQGEAVVEDGCGSDRALPVTCVLVEHDGSVPAFPSTFEKCLGDPNG